MATPVLAVAGYCRLAPVGNVARAATLVAGLGLAAAAQLVVVADAYSCVDDDCLRLPVAARQLPFASTWVAATALWSATRARRPATSRSRSHCPASMSPLAA